VSLPEASVFEYPCCYICQEEISEVLLYCLEHYSAGSGYSKSSHVAREARRQFKEKPPEERSFDIMLRGKGKRMADPEYWTTSHHFGIF